MRYRGRDGFALPTIIIASVITFLMLTSAVAAVASIQSSMSSQYYNRLAQEAAESGINRARSCLEINGYIPQWTSSALHTNTTCSGGAACDNVDSCYLIKNGNIRVQFSVSTPQSLNTSQLVTATGTVELLRSSSGRVWRSYSYSTKAKVGIDLSLNSVVFGYHHDGAYFATIAADGAVRTVGNNMYGQLGNGTTDDSLSPKKLLLPDGIRPVSIFTSFLSQGTNMFIIANDGNVYGAGQNSQGQLGDGTRTNRTIPVKFKLPAGEDAKYVAVLGYDTYVLTQSGNIYAAGRCASGDLGYNYTINGCSDQSMPHRVALPTPNPSDPNTMPTTNISLDASAIFVRMQGGRVYVWGDNTKGQYGDGTVTDSSLPVKVGCYGDSGCPRAVKVAFDGVSSYILDNTGRVMAAGYNGFGELGDGTSGNWRFSPVEFKLPSSATGKIIDVTTDEYYASVLTNTGEVWSAGINGMGQLGDGTTTGRSTPVKFQLPAGVKATSVYVSSRGLAAPAYNNIYVIGDDGKVYASGSNTYGQTGQDPSKKWNASIPVALPVIDGTAVRAEQVQSGYGTTVILTTSQRIYTLGNNSDGQLGDGTQNNSYTPKANHYTNIIPVTIF